LRDMPPTSTLPIGSDVWRQVSGQTLEHLRAHDYAQFADASNSSRVGVRSLRVSPEVVFWRNASMQPRSRQKRMCYFWRAGQEHDYGHTWT
jgi:hypothetical protein